LVKDIGVFIIDSKQGKKRKAGRLGGEEAKQQVEGGRRKAIIRLKVEGGRLKVRGSEFFCFF
jgi:hypothetical protein